jgi:crotonobetainyl-CoA:carnitine CoA-transferase CaiB-like acyl-CoA transferase
MKTMGLPIKFSHTPGAVKSGAPLFGQHSREILAEHGYSETKIAALIEAGVVAVPASDEGETPPA